jgi:hypothetical protein
MLHISRGNVTSPARVELGVPYRIAAPDEHAAREADEIRRHVAAMKQMSLTDEVRLVGIVVVVVVLVAVPDCPRRAYEIGPNGRVTSYCPADVTTMSPTATTPSP